MNTKANYSKMIHLGAKRLGYTDESDYRAWLESIIGKRSTKDCTLDELAAVTKKLRALNALENPRALAMRGATNTDDRPTPAQWGTVEKLCKQLGIKEGYRDARLIAFCVKVCKVTNPRFLKREGMQKLIAALNKWINNTTKQSTNTIPTIAKEAIK